MPLLTLTGFLLLHEHLREGRGAAACVCHHRLWHRQHCLHCCVGESWLTLGQLAGCNSRPHDRRAAFAESQACVTCSVTHISFHQQQLVKFITHLAWLTWRFPTSQPRDTILSLQGHLFHSLPSPSVRNCPSPPVWPPGIAPGRRWDCLPHQCCWCSLPSGGVPRGVRQGWH